MTQKEYENALTSAMSEICKILESHGFIGHPVAAVQQIDDHRGLMVVCLDLLVARNLLAILSSEELLVSSHENAH